MKNNNVSNTEIRNDINKLQNLVFFLDNCNALDEIKKKAESFSKISNLAVEKGFILPSFKVLVPIDCLLLNQFSEELFVTFVTSPETALNWCRIIITSIFGLLKNKWILRTSDVDLFIDYKTIPPLPSQGLGLISICGIITAKSYPLKYERSSVWQCADVTCEGHESFRWRSNIGVECPFCCGFIEECIAGKEVGDFMLARFLTKCSVTGNCHVNFSQMIKIKDELFLDNNWCLGQEYRLMGIREHGVFQVLAVETTCHPIEALISHGHTVSLPPLIAEVYLQVRELLPLSSWAFTVSMASLIAADILPPSMYLHLKYGLLLSLASQKRQSHPVPIIAVGADTAAAQKVMFAAAQLAERIVYATGGESLGGSIRLDSANIIWEEMGELTAASNGVCCLGDWSNYRKKAGLSAVIASVEKGRVPVHNLTGFDLPHTTLPLQAAVWSYWGNVTSTKNDKQLRTFIDVFGIPFLFNEPNEIQQETLCATILDSATETDGVNNSRSELMNQFKDYIRIANAREVHLTEAASNLIKNYFVASRKERPDCLPVCATQTITSLSESHAKLSLRHEITFEDVALVIYLYEQSISTIFGCPNISQYEKLEWQQEEPFFVFMDRQLAIFANWLESYTKYT